MRKSALSPKSTAECLDTSPALANCIKTTPALASFVNAMKREDRGSAESCDATQEAGKSFEFDLDSSLYTAKQCTEAPAGSVNGPRDPAKSLNTKSEPMGVEREGACFTADSCDATVVAK